MKLVTYSRNESISCGILTDSGIIDIPSAWRQDNPPRSVKEILERGPSCLEKLVELAGFSDNLIAADSVKLLAPIPRPGKAIALAGNYSEHIREASFKRGFKLGLSDSSGNAMVPRPFIMPPTVVIGTDEEIPFSRLGIEQFGKEVFGNMIALGRLMALVGVDASNEELAKVLPLKYREENLSAVQFGYHLKEEDLERGLNSRKKRKFDFSSKKPGEIGLESESKT